MSAPSYEKINFSLRPAKGAERKMIVETVSCLSALFPMAAYRYIGFGSPYFSDFSLVHRRLGITDMVCIEKEKQDKERFKFNRPFKCIDFIFENSSIALPSLKWEGRPTVIWLDYDKAISEAILSDIRVVCSSIAPGSFILLTVRAEANDFGQSLPERDQKLKSIMGDGLPVHTLAEIANKNFPKFLWKIIDSHIRRVIADRSGGVSYEDGLEYQQILNFDYSDGAKMLTLGGVIYQRNQQQQLTQCGFPSLSYSRSGVDSCSIKAPLLTFRELRTLDALLPGDTPSLSCVPQEEVDAYCEHYRYFPNFVDVVEP